MHDKRIMAAVAGLLSLVMIVLVYLNFCSNGSGARSGKGTPAATPTPAVETAETTAAGNTPVFRATLYFEGEDTELLLPEIRSIAAAGSEVRMMRDTVSELLKGPAADHLPVVPEGTRLIDLFMLPDGLLCLDFNEALSAAHSGGCSAEIMTIYAIVDTMAVNFPKVKAVQFLIEGRQVGTLAGHVAIRHPVSPNWSLLDVQ